MNLFQKQFDQRKSYRCPISQSQQEAELQVRRRRFVVRLYNESSGGFAALTDQDLGVAVGDILTLTTGCGRYKVRVAHITPIDPAQTEGDNAGGMFRLGLERLLELAVSPEGQTATGSLLTRGHQRSFGPMGVLVIGGATVLVVAAMMAAAAALNDRNGPLVPKFARWQQAGSRPVQSPEQTLAEVVKEVGLSRPQQIQIRDIAQQTVDALRAIDGLWKNDPPEVRSRKQALLLEAAKREITKLLSKEQRARWQILAE